MKYKILNRVYFASLILAAIIYLFITVLGIIFNIYIPYPGSLIIGYIYIFFLFPIIIISFILIFYKNTKQVDIIDSIKELRGHILSIVAFFFFLLTCYYSSKYFSNRIPVTIVNKTGSSVYDVRIIGRNGILQIDSLESNGSLRQKFHGRNIIYNSSNDSINYVWLYYKMNNKENAIKMTGKWTKLHDELLIKIFENDSIYFKNKYIR